MLIGSSIDRLVPAADRALHSTKVTHFFETWRRTGTQPTKTRIYGKEERPAVAAKPDGRGGEIRFEATIKIEGVHSTKDVKGYPHLILAQINSIEEELNTRRALAGFKVMINDAPNGIVVIDRRNKIVFINREVERIWGYSLAHLLMIEADVNIFVNPGFAAEHSCILQFFWQSVDSGTYDKKRSTVMHRERPVEGVDCNGKKVNVVLRVGLLEPLEDGKKCIYAFVTDASKYIPVQEFKKTLLESKLPAKLAADVMICAQDRSSYKAKYQDCVIIMIDMINSTKTLKAMCDRDGTLSDAGDVYLNTYEEAIYDIAEFYGLDVVKGMGDGALVIASAVHIDDDPKTRVIRAICYAQSFIKWAGDKYHVRIGMSYGTVNVRVPMRRRSGCSWDIFAAEPIAVAKRMESTAFRGIPEWSYEHTWALKISSELYHEITESDVASTFTEVHQDLEGLRGLEDKGKKRADGDPGFPEPHESKGEEVECDDRVFTTYRCTGLLSEDILNKVRLAHQSKSETRKAALAHFKIQEERASIAAGAADSRGGCPFRSMRM